jgi:hypothetical protein
MDYENIANLATLIAQALDALGAAASQVKDWPGGDPSRQPALTLLEQSRQPARELMNSLRQQAAQAVYRVD